MLHHFSDTKAKMTLEGFWCSYFAYNLLNWCPCRDRDRENKQRVAETCPLPTVVWSLAVTCRYEVIWFKRGGWICLCWVWFLSTPALFFLYSLRVYLFVFALLIQHISCGLIVYLSFNLGCIPNSDCVAQLCTSCLKVTEEESKCEKKEKERK